MVQLKTLFVSVLSLSVATCNPIAKRDAALVLTDLTAVNNALTVLTNSVNAYTGGLIPALTIQTNGNTLDTAVKKATTDANASAVFSTADSASVTSRLTGLVAPIQAAISALITKEPLFDASLLDPLVLAQIQTLASDSAALGAALRAKSTAADVVTQQTAQATIDASFQFAIAVFS